MSAIKAVLFDKDGTLIDYARTWFPTNRAVALEIAGGDLALSHELLALGGHDPITDVVAPSCPLSAGTAEEIALLWQDLLPGRDPIAVARQIDDGFLRHVSASLTGVPELHTTLQGLRGAGLRLGVATSDTERAAHENLAQLGVSEHFEFFCGYDTGHGAKPGPGMIMAFAQAVGLSPQQICMVGDSHHDLEMAHNAGAGLAVGVLTGPAAREDLQHLAHHVLDDIRGLAGLLGV